MATRKKKPEVVDLVKAGVPVEHHDGVQFLLKKGVSIDDILAFVRLISLYAPNAWKVVNDLAEFVAAGKFSVSDWLGEFQKILKDLNLAEEEGDEDEE